MARSLSVSRSLSVHGSALVLLALAAIVIKGLTQMLNVPVKHLDVDAFLGSVDGQRPDGQACDGSNVPGCASLRLDDENSPP